ARVAHSSEILASFPGEARERNLSWFDRPVALDLSSSGDTLLFNETGTAGKGTLYLRKTDGSEPKRMGEGFLAALSPDGKWVVENGPAHRLTLMPAGPGSSRPIDLGGVVPTGRVGFFPDGKR